MIYIIDHVIDRHYIHDPFIELHVDSRAHLCRNLPLGFDQFDQVLSAENWTLQYAKKSAAQRENLSKVRCLMVFNMV
jgi:anaerobic selenocysteine-containing dehydrogenase